MLQQTILPSQQELFSGLPFHLAEYLSPDTEEIRFRRNQPVIFLEGHRELVTSYRLNARQMEDLLDYLTEGSPASYFDSFRSGFMTIKGGHRVGIAGTAVYENGALSYVKDVSSVNLRIAKEVKGAADQLFQTVGQIAPLPGILIISPPGQGKTTLLRDFIRQLSEKTTGIRVAVIDERGEIAATFQGDAQNCLGSRCDVLNGYQKADGIISAIRSLSPDVIAVDEIGTPEDEEGLCYAHHAGVSVVATIHGNRSGNFRKNIRKLTEEQVFDYEVYLSNKTIKSKNGKTNRVDLIQRTNGE